MTVCGQSHRARSTETIHICGILTTEVLLFKHLTKLPSTQSPQQHSQQRQQLVLPQEIRMLITKQRHRNKKYTR